MEVSSCNGEDGLVLSTSMLNLPGTTPEAVVSVIPDAQTLYIKQQNSTESAPNSSTSAMVCFFVTEPPEAANLANYSLFYEVGSCLMSTAMQPFPAERSSPCPANMQCSAATTSSCTLVRCACVALRCRSFVAVEEKLGPTYFALSQRVCDESGEGEHVYV